MHVLINKFIDTYVQLCALYTIFSIHFHIYKHCLFPKFVFINKAGILLYVYSETIEP